MAHGWGPDQVPQPGRKSLPEGIGRQRQTLARQPEGQRMMDGKRTSIELLRDILVLRFARRAEILYRTGIAPAQLGKYLDFLVSRGFLAEESPKGGKAKVYQITPKGEELLTKIQELLELLELEKVESPPEPRV